MLQGILDLEFSVGRTINPKPSHLFHTLFPMPSKKLRIAFLLAILAAVVWVAATGRPAPPPDWDEPLKVVIYPYNADGSEVAQRFIAELTLEDFLPVADFFIEQAARYELPLERPFDLALGAQIDDAPMLPPSTRGYLTRVRWGLSVRWWHFRFRDQVNKPDIIVIAHYLDPDSQPEMLHSVAIAEYRVALTRLLASQQDYQNQQSLVIMAHEILHTVGATDLYDPFTRAPRFPEGFADPDQEPTYPQLKAELMAPQIPISPYREVQADYLSDVVIGEKTAREIRWIRKP